MTDLAEVRRLHNDWLNGDADESDAAADKLHSLVPEMADEIERLRPYEEEYRKWMSLTDWVQDECNSGRLRPGIHRADLMRMEIENLRDLLDRCETVIVDIREDQMEKSKIEEFIEEVRRFNKETAT